MAITDNPDDPSLLAFLPRLMQLGNLLNRSQLAEQAMEQVGSGLDRPAMTVLIVLHLGGHPLRVGEIAARMHVAGPHVTRHVHELERRKLVRRLPDEQDRRARIIELTPDGTAIAERYLGTVLGWLGAALTDWSPEDRATFATLLGRFADGLTARLSALTDEPPTA